jgi:division protein CdvB (Snf7/Vps24/ESCRT-III family)
MPRQARTKLNIRSEDARLRKSAAELTRRLKKFATKWDRISNDGRVAIERSTARSLRAASGQVNKTSKRMGQILEWLDRVRQMEKAA